MGYSICVYYIYIYIHTYIHIHFIQGFRHWSALVRNLEDVNGSGSFVGYEDSKTLATSGRKTGQGLGFRGVGPMTPH